MLNEKIRKWEKRNPIVMKLLKFIFAILIAFLVQVSVLFFQASVVSEKAVIKEEPSRNASVVCAVTKNETVIILSEEKYWYRVVYEPIDDDKVIYSGYISKRAVQKIEEDILIKKMDGLLCED